MVQAPAKRKGISREHLLFLAFIGPNFFLLGVFSYWPLIYQAYLSLTRWDMISPTKTFVGFDNYHYMFTGSEFYQVLLNTFVFTVAILVGSLVLGLGLALLLNQPLRGRVAGRAIVFAPYVLSGAAIGLVWAYIFDPVYGLLRVFFNAFGFASPNWLVDTSWALPAVIIVYLWKNVGYSAVIYLAGLQNISHELYEAAKVDGASDWESFWHITLPQLSPVTFFLTVTTILFSIQAFDIIAVMTEGGPVNATTTLVWYLYQQGFIAFRAGTAAAAGMLLFVIMLLITIFQLRFVQRRVHYS
nr:MAG: glycerol-3-phosphate ABC transporter permease [Chloroflexota bacterium]